MKAAAFNEGVPPELDFAYQFDIIVQNKIELGLTLKRKAAILKRNSNAKMPVKNMFR